PAPPTRLRAVSSASTSATSRSCPGASASAAPLACCCCCSCCSCPCCTCTSPSGGRRSPMRETLGEKIFRIVVLVGLGLFVLLPLYVMITTSLKPLGDVQAGFSWWPSRLTFGPFIEMWSTVPLARYF